MLTLKAEKRDKKTKADRVRKGGKIPAVFYGRKEASTSVSVGENDFLKAWKEAGESSIISLVYEGKDMPALINEVAVDPVRGTPIHIDFYVTEADREVEVNVPLVFVGEAPAVRELGGTLVKVLYELPISGLPKNLPHEITVDISKLATLESVIEVKDISIPAGVSAKASPEDVVASIAVAKEEVVEEPVFDATAVEVEKKGKKEEEGETPEEGEGSSKPTSSGKDKSGKDKKPS